MKNIDAELEALRRKEVALRETIAAAKVRRQKLMGKEDARLFSIAGEAVIRSAKRSPQFELMLKQVFQSAEMRDTDRAFLAGKGWL